MRRSQLGSSPAFRAAVCGVAAAAAAALATAAPGCATSRSLPDRSWVEMRTPHYAVVSSLSPSDTLRLAHDVESFREAVEFTLGAELPAAAVPTRVVAFDGRSLERPFDVRGEPGYLLPRLRGDVLVLRTGAGWRGDAPLALRVRHARHLLRSAGAMAWPPWIASGLAQVAGTTEARGERAVVGMPHDEHVRRLRRSAWVPVDRVLAARDLRGWNDRERELFDAESWALAHALRVGAARRPDPAHAFGEVARALLAPDPEHALRRYVRRERFDSFEVRVGAGRPAPARALSTAEVHGVLGELSLALGRTAQAREYFERALAAEPASARALAGLGAAATRAARWEEAGTLLARAAELAPHDPLVWLERGAHHQARAAATADAGERARRTDAARRDLERSRDLEPGLPETHARLGALALLEGQDPSRGLAPLERALALAPGSIEVQLLLARVHRALGRIVEARAAATRVLTSSRTRDAVREARALLDALEVPRDGT